MMRDLLQTYPAQPSRATASASLGSSPLNANGERHLPIGIPNTVDALKTFVEAEGCFSPGFGTYGVYFWVFDHETRRLTAPTMDDVPCEHGLGEGALLIPWSAWLAGDILVRTEVCQTIELSPAGPVHVVSARVRLACKGSSEERVSLYAALRPLGPAGGDVRHLAAEPDALLAEGHPALVALEMPDAAGVCPTDTIGEHAFAGTLPSAQGAESAAGDCSGALRFDITLRPGEIRVLRFVCPVLPGRRAAGHRWDGTSEWAQYDLTPPDPPDEGVLQPDPGLAWCRSLEADALFARAEGYWQEFLGPAGVTVPDPRWGECLRAITAHVALAMNEGAPDVAVVNYNVFNRDGVYTANILQKAGRFDLAAAAIDYFLAHPFNGRAFPEADNPGQILWIAGEHWRFTRDPRWLERIYPSVRRLAALIRYYRTTPGPHWVSLTSLDFGDALSEAERRELLPGRCDGTHPEYTEAFDVAGLRAAADLARALGAEEDAVEWQALAESLLDAYGRRFGNDLAEGYGSYCVLWPCRLYPLDRGAGHERFRGVGAQEPAGWRYFPLATAHQGLLAGNRAAGHETVQRHLAHPQMRGWYAFDEGGPSGVGGWNHARTTWPRGEESVAMPHGWAIAEMYLLLRDCLLFEDGGRLVLLSGIPPEWFTHPEGIAVRHLPTHFGACSLEYRPTPDGAVLTLSRDAAPPDGFVLRLPPDLMATVTADDAPVAPQPGGDVLLPPGTCRVKLRFGEPQ